MSLAIWDQRLQSYDQMVLYKSIIIMIIIIIITQCYLPPDTSEHTPTLTPVIQAGTQFTYPRGMEGWVDLGDFLHTEMVYPPTLVNTKKTWLWKAFPYY